MQDFLSAAISPDGLMPCQLCHKVPKVMEIECAINGHKAYRVNCPCNRGTYSAIDRDEVIAYWNRNQNYEAGDWVHEWNRKYEAEKQRANDEYVKMCKERGWNPEWFSL